jgi:uncharacterized protein (TIGR03435 family)
MPKVGSGRNRAIKLISIVLGSCQLALCQSGPPAHQAAQQPPSYEVATIKPANENGFAFTLRMYILVAFGMHPRSSQRLIGPDWIDKKSYDIEGKVPDSLRDAMSKMTREERMAQTQLMMQSLLVDRFKLKYHFETRELQAYKLVVAKGGLRLKVQPDSTKTGLGVRNADQINEINGSDIIPVLVSMLTNAPEIDGQPVLDDTGPKEIYNLTLKWSSPVGAGPPGDAASSSDTDAPSLFTALGEQLGLKLMAAKAPVKVVVIDHIEPPSPN